MVITEYNAAEHERQIRREERAEGRAEMEKENITSAIREGLPKETIMRIFKISAEKYAKYLSMM